jgi:hypothetical protein
MASKGWFGQSRRHALAAKGIKTRTPRNETVQKITSVNEWYEKAVQEKPPYSLQGWSKNKKSVTRRKLALASRPKNWTQEHRLRSAGQALQALANVTQDKETKKAASADAKYFFQKLKNLHEGKQ